MDNNEIEALKTAFKRIAYQRIEKWEALRHEGMVVQAKADAVTGLGMLSDAINDLEKSAPATCDWWEEDDDNMPGTYRTDCGRIWSFTEGGLKDNEMHYCMGCGKKTREVKLDREDERRIRRDM